MNNFKFLTSRQLIKNQVFFCRMYVSYAGPIRQSSNLKSILCYYDGIDVVSINNEDTKELISEVKDIISKFYESNVNNANLQTVMNNFYLQLSYQNFKPAGIPWNGIDQYFSLIGRLYKNKF